MGRYNEWKRIGGSPPPRTLSRLRKIIIPEEIEMVPLNTNRRSFQGQAIIPISQNDSPFQSENEDEDVPNDGFLSFFFFFFSPSLFF